MSKTSNEATVKFNYVKVIGIVTILGTVAAISAVPIKIVNLEAKQLEQRAVLEEHNNRLSTIEKLSAAQTEILLRVEKSVEKLNDKMDTRLITKP